MTEFKEDDPATIGNVIDVVKHFEKRILKLERQVNTRINKLYIGCGVGLLIITVLAIVV